MLEVMRNIVRRTARAGVLRTALVIGAWGALGGLGLVTAGCTRTSAPPKVTLRWLAGHTAPEFDPGGPPDPLRRAIERMLSYGLFEFDTTGRVEPLAAESWENSADHRTFTVKLRAGLRFTDGTEATSSDFRDALLAALGRTDHATAAWLLAPVAGIDRIRAGRPLPALGIEAVTPNTLRFRLARPDTTMPERLAFVGLGAPWRHARGGTWPSVVGLGPYRVEKTEGVRMMRFVRAGPNPVRQAIADTIVARFALGAPRARVLLRRQVEDLVWPLAPALLQQPLPAGYRTGERFAAPPRRLLMVFRADVPPTTALAARSALACSFNRVELLDALGLDSAPDDAWLAGAGAFDFPRLDGSQARQWMSRGGFGASFHVVLAFDADGEGAEVARTLQGEWSALGIYAELRELRGADALLEPLRSPAAQVQLVTAQAPCPGAAGELAALVMPLRGPAIGSFRTGWQTREFDPWIAGGPGPALKDPVTAQDRLAEERVALPVAEVPWRWVEREGGPPVAFRKDFGPDFTSRGRQGQTRPASGAGSR